MHSVLPSTIYFPSTLRIKDSCGFPLGFVVQPLKLDQSKKKRNFFMAEKVERCECGAYINTLCTIRARNWDCCICRRRNNLGDGYYAADRTVLPEFSAPCAEFSLLKSPEENEANEEEEEEKKKTWRALGPIEITERPIFLAVVDETGTEERLEVIKASILSAIQKFPPGSLFGLISFSGETITLWELRPTTTTTTTTSNHNTHSHSGNHHNHHHNHNSDSHNDNHNEQSTNNTKFYPFARHININHLTTLVEEGIPNILFSDICTLNDFVVEVDVLKDDIISTIESLKPNSEIKYPGSCFGTVVSSLIDLLEEHSVAAGNAEFAHVRVLNFLTQIPSLGSGKCLSQQMQPTKNPLKPSHNFYEKQGKRCVSLGGVCFDLYILSSKFIDLATFQPLAHITGGVVLLYEDTENITLPQDIARQVDPQLQLVGTQVVLRLRCSTEMSISQTLPILEEDKSVDQLYRIPFMHSNDFFSFDINFTSGDAFSATSFDVQGVIQMACAFTYFDEKGRLQRHLRIHTFGYQPTDTEDRVYAGVKSDIVMSLLCRKVLKNCYDSGNFAQSRELLFDWLTLLASRVITRIPDNELGNPMIANSELISRIFYYHHSLRLFPHLIWCLILNPIIAETSVHADERAYLYTLLRTLSPEALIKCIRPQINGYIGIDGSPIERDFPLSMNWIEKSKANIFTADNFRHFIIFYTQKVGNIPFPPTSSSFLGGEIEERKHLYITSPKIIYCRDEDSQSRHFQVCLLNDSKIDSKSFGYDTFLGEVASELSKIIKK